MIVPSKFVPTGNVYPQVTVALDFKNSEPEFPAGYYNLMIRLSSLLIKISGFI